MKQLNEVARMQQIAGINEIKIKPPRSNDFSLIERFLEHYQAYNQDINDDDDDDDEIIPDLNSFKLIDRYGKEELIRLIYGSEAEALPNDIYSNIYSSGDFSVEIVNYPKDPAWEMIASDLYYKTFDGFKNGIRKID
jgi:hypothetical protein